jgi:type I restriction enzyme M protein
VLQLSLGPEPTPLDLHRELDELHELIYRRGGISPVNAAIEELSKLLLLEVKLSDDPDYEIPGLGPLSRVLDPQQIAGSRDVMSLKCAFRHVVSLAEYAGRLPDGGSQPMWPDDEPLRVSRPDVLAEAVSILRRQLKAADEAGHFDLIGTAFDVFLRGRYDHAGGLGTHLTPHTVATNLARLCLVDLDLLSERVGRPVCGDPCCGTGRFLVAVLQELASRQEEPNHASFLEHGLFGADQSASSVAKARINLLLLNVRQPNVFVVEDSIIDAHIDRLRGSLRLILTNPPFGDGKYDSAEGIEATSTTLPKLLGKTRIDPALAFLVRCLELLGDGGRLGIILPDGLVDGPVLRDALLGAATVRLRDVSIEANVSLPTPTFALAGTVAKTSALVLRKQSRQHGSVFLARAEHVGYLKQGTVSVPDPHGDDLPAICEAGASAFRSQSLERAVPDIDFLSQAPLAALVPLEGLGTLDPARVDPGVVSSRSALSGGKGVPFRALIRAVKRPQGLSDDGAPFVSVLHIDDLGAVAWHEAVSYRPSTPGLIAHPGDLIFSLLNPRKLRATVVPDGVGRIFCSSEFGVFEAVDRDPYEALVLLHHPLVRSQLTPLGRGTSSSRRRITSADLLDVLAPRLARAELSRLASDLRSALAELRQASMTAAQIYASASASPRAHLGRVT